MNHRDTLFLLRPGFSDHAKGDKVQKWFCPYAAQVRGMLGYYPELEATLEIVEIDFAKPRQAVVDLLGEEHQVTPVLVLHPDSPARVGVPFHEANGHRFIDKTMDILRYLAETRGVPLPHR